MLSHNRGSTESELNRQRLESLLESGLREPKEPEKYVREPRNSVRQIDKERVKRQPYFLKALADPTRIKILHLLKNRSMTTCEVMIAPGLTEPNTSHHMILLERNGIVRSERRGKLILYELQKPTLKEAFHNIIG